MKKITLVLTLLLCAVVGVNATLVAYTGEIDGTSTKTNYTIAASNFLSLCEGDYFVVTLSNSTAGAKISLKEAYDDYTSLVYEGDANTTSYTTPTLSGDLLTNIKGHGLYVEIEKAKITALTIVRGKTVSSLEPTVASDVVDASASETYASKDYSDLSTRFAALEVGDIVRFNLTPNSDGYHQISIYGLTGSGWAQTINVVPEYSATTGNFDVAVSTADILSYFQGTATDQKALRIWIKNNTLTSIQIIKTLSITETANPDCESGTYSRVALTRSLKSGFNSLCLPFGGSKAELGLDSSDKIYELATTGSSASSIKLSEVDAITANKPYLVDCAAARTLTSSFTDLTVTCADNATKTTYDGWNMICNYTPGSMEGNYMLYSGELRLCGSGPTLKGLRAYFTYSGEARETVSLDFENGATKIKNVSTKLEIGNLYYNLNGQQMAQPTKGLNIVNGKKVIIK